MVAEVAADVSAGQYPDWPVVGREHELARIRRLVAENASVVLMGRGGVGRSTLLRMAQQWAADSGASVLTVGATPGGDGAPPMSLSRWLDSFLSKVGHEREGATGRGRGKPKVVVVDDAHLLDSQSATMLHHAVSLGLVSVIATVRTDRSVPDGLNRLWVQRVAERIDVPAFGRAAVAELLDTRLHDAVDPNAIDRLWQVTGGNALLLRELIESALSDGSLRCRDGVWSWTGLGHVDGRLADVVQIQLDVAGRDDRELLGMVALAEPLRASLPSVRALADSAERLTDREVLTIDSAESGPRLRFRYPLFGHVLLASMSELTRWRLSGQLADELEAMSIGDDDILDVVRLRRAGGTCPEPDVLMAAAAAAARRGDFRLAEELCLLTSPAGELPTDHRIGLVLGEALSGQRRFAEAEVVYAAVDDVPGRRADGALVRARAINLALGLHRVADAIDLLDRATPPDVLESGPSLQATKAMLWMLADRLSEVVAQARDVLGGGPAASVEAQIVVPPAALACMELGDAEGALALLRGCGEVDGWEPQSRLFHRAMTLSGLYSMGSRSDVMRVLGHLDGVEIPALAQPFVATAKAGVLRGYGRFSDSIGLLRHALTFAGDLDLFTTRAWILAQLAGTLVAAGHDSEALRVLDEAHAAQRSAPPFAIAANGVAMETALVRAHLGDVASARGLARALADGCRVAGRPSQELAALHLVARLGEAREVAGRAQTLRAAASSSLMALQADHIAALAAKDVGALAAVARRFAECGMQPLSAEAAALGRRIYHNRGRRRVDRTAALACQQLLANHAGPLPRWVGEEGHGGQALTTREMQVAVMAADGSTNRDIAARLVVSIRTVENHLQRVYAKLGVTGRAELPSRLGSHAPRHG